MGKKVTMVRMVAKDQDGLERDFPVAQAEAIMRMPRHGGWGLAKDTEFEFTEEHGIRYIEHKGEADEKAEKGND